MVVHYKLDLVTVEQELVVEVVLETLVLNPKILLLMLVLMQVQIQDQEAVAVVPHLVMVLHSQLVVMVVQEL